MWSLALACLLAYGGCFLGVFFVHCSLVGIHETRRRGVAIPGFGIIAEVFRPKSGPLISTKFQGKG
jgi:hypothetical protein